MLLEQQNCAVVRLGGFASEALFDGLGAREPLGHRGQLFAPRDDALLQRFEIAAEIYELVGSFGGLRFGGGA